MESQPTDLVLHRLQRLENQMAAVIHLTKMCLALIKRLSAGEHVPIEQIQSLERAIESLSARKPN